MNIFFLVPKLRLGMPSRNAPRCEERFDADIIKQIWAREQKTIS